MTYKPLLEVIREKGKKNHGHHLTGLDCRALALLLDDHLDRVKALREERLAFQKERIDWRVDRRHWPILCFALGVTVCAMLRISLSVFGVEITFP